MWGFSFCIVCKISSVIDWIFNKTKKNPKPLTTWINLIFFSHSILILKAYFKNLFIVETEQKEIQVLTKLKETVDKQREELRKYKTEVKHKAADCEAVSVA